jgi:hypothetical protein
MAIHTFDTPVWSESLRCKPGASLPESLLTILKTTPSTPKYKAPTTSTYYALSATLGSTNPSQPLEARMKRLDIRSSTEPTSDYFPDEDEYQDQYQGDSEADFICSNTAFNLVDLEIEHGNKPIFTRNLLASIALNVTYISSLKGKSAFEQDTDELSHQQEDGKKVKIWTGAQNADAVTVNYMTRVELHSGFRRQFGATHERTRNIRQLNESTNEKNTADLVPPYYITSYQKWPDTSHIDDAVMTSFQQRLQRTHALWQKSTCCAQLCSVIVSGASAKPAPITKIVCIGLGKLHLRPEWYQSALQHFAVFSIASKLNKLNKSRNRTAGPVQIIVQDPRYEERDRILLPGICTHPVNFGLSDPETILAIDGNTLVVTAFLPVAVPLVQILADLHAEDSTQAPAMMLCDKISLNAMRVDYNLRNRGSPGVVSMLNNYRRWEKGFGQIEKELEEDVRGDATEWSFWLEKMDLWLKK